MATIFTKIINRELPAHIVHEDDYCIAFLDINPLQVGHTLVVSKMEVDDVFDLPQTDYQGLFLFSKKVSKAIKQSFECKRVGLSIIGLEVPHVHIHLIPIREIGDMNFSRPKLSLSQKQFEAAASKIKGRIL